MTRPSRFAIGLWTVVLELTTKWYKPHAAANRALPKAAWLQLLPNKTELKLIGVARASLEELLLDCHDFCGRETWRRGQRPSTAQAVRKLVYRHIRTYETYKAYVELLIVDCALLSSLSSY
jgi:hypothetical protein